MELIETKTLYQTNMGCRYTLNDVFHVEEQPGDATRYTHIIITMEDELLVLKDEDRGGASVLIPYYIRKQDLKYLSTIKPLDTPDKWVTYVIEHELERLLIPVHGMDPQEENAYTVASVIRSCIAILNRSTTWLLKEE